jgi:hypothetical protein
MTADRAAVEPRFQISVFDSEHDAQVKHRAVTLDEVFARMTNFRPRRRKNPAPCWSPAEYHDDETRGILGVKQVNVLVYDIDSGVTPTELQNMLGNLRYCLATTFSSTEEHWKLRLAIGLHSPIPAGRFDDVWARGQAALVHGNADESAKDCSRIYFNAAHPIGVTPFSVIRNGALLDWHALPAVARRTRSVSTSDANDLPISIETLDFISNGAPEGEQRTRACAAARSLLSSGYSVERAAALIWQGLQASPQRKNDPWLEPQAMKIVESIAESVPPPLRPRQPQTERERATAKLIEDLLRPRSGLPTHWTAQALMDTIIDPPRPVVPGLLFEGLGVFAARPKFGKSWIAFDMGIAVSEGTQALHSIPCLMGDVHYYALEDGPSRLQGRLRSLLGDGVVPARLEISTKLARLDEGGLLDVAEWLDAHPAASLVIIDTWKRVQPRLKRGQDMDLYGAEYDAANTLKALADQHRVAILLIHHTRKPFKGGSAQDFLDEVLGTSGLTGAADSIIVAKRERNDNEGVLHITGRDVAETSRAMTWDEDTHWTIGGDAEQSRQSSERRALIAALEVAGDWLTPTELSMHLEGKTLNAVKLLAWKAGRDGAIQGDGEGRYAALGVPPAQKPPYARARARTGKYEKPGHRGGFEGSEQGSSEIETSPSTTVSQPRDTVEKPWSIRETVVDPEPVIPDAADSSTTVSQTHHGFSTVSRSQETVVEADLQSRNGTSEGANLTTVSPVSQGSPARARARARPTAPEWTVDDKGRATL